MNKEERRRNKISKLMLELLNLYLDDRKPIVLDYSMLNMHYKLTFNAKKEEFGFYALKGVAIICNNNNQIKKCCELADKLGWKRYGGKSYSEYDNMLNEGPGSMYYGNFAIDFFRGFSDYAHRYARDGYKMRSAKWFLNNFTPKE